jgi:hypothetical protein
MLTRIFMMVRGEIVEPRRETGARSPENPMLLVLYCEGPSGEPTGQRLVIAANRRLEQKRS